MAYGFPFHTYKVLTFDIYGTLIDWETGIFQGLSHLLQRLPETHPRRNAVGIYARQMLLGIYKGLELKTQRENPRLPYPEILAQCYEKLAGDFLKVPFEREEAVAFGKSVGTWPTFHGTEADKDILAILGKYYKLVGLCNVDAASLAATFAGPLQGSKIKFDAVYTADEIGSYKPDLANFEYLIEHIQKDFGVQKSEILHVAQSLTHDHVPAKAVGLPPGLWIEMGGESALLGGNKAKLEREGKVKFGAQLMTLLMMAKEVEWYFETQVK